MTDMTNEQRIFWNQAVEAAALVADKDGDRLDRAAQKAHRENNMDLYEAIESNAVVATRIAANIRALSKRKPKA